MFTLSYFCICLYCMLQLGFMIVMEKRHRYAVADQGRHFLKMLVIVQCSFVSDILSSIYVESGLWLYVTAAGNYLEILLNTLLIPIFFRFASGQIGDLSRERMRRWETFFWTVAAACALLVLSTAVTGKVFYFDEANRYHRGPLFMLPMALLFLMMAAVEGFLISQRHKIEMRFYQSMTLFIIAPLVGWILQSVIFGLPFALLGITFAAQVVFTNIQDRNIDVDYLTGAFNRQALDRYLRHKIDTYEPCKPFSGIMLDIDQFKAINDQFGHFEGDVALIQAVRVLRDSIGRGGFIARCGGDEFVVLLDGGSPNHVEEAIRKIERQLAAHHGSDDKPYRLGFSMGTAVYRPSDGNSADAFLKLLDQRMYEEKRRRQAFRANCLGAAEGAIR